MEQETEARVTPIGLSRVLSSGVCQREREKEKFEWDTFVN